MEMPAQRATRISPSTSWLPSASLPMAKRRGAEACVISLIVVSFPALPRSSSPLMHGEERRCEQSLLLQVRRRLHALLRRLQSVHRIPFDGSRLAVIVVELLPVLADHRSCGADDVLWHLFAIEQLHRRVDGRIPVLLGEHCCFDAIGRLLLDSVDEGQTLASGANRQQVVLLLASRLPCLQAAKR